MNKQVLRSLFLEKRKTLAEGEFQRRNHLLLNEVTRFINSRSDAKNYHIFLSIEKFLEPDTWPIFRRLLASPDHSVFLSRTNFKAKRLTHFEIEDEANLEKSKFGISEPKTGNEINPNTLDIVFVPLISFDLTGNRIGYGAGLYDRFLSQVRPDCLKVGLAITPPLDNIDYTNQHDVPLDYCISHLGVNAFQN